MSLVWWGDEHEPKAGEKTNGKKKSVGALFCVRVLLWLFVKENSICLNLQQEKYMSTKRIWMLEENIDVLF